MDWINDARSMLTLLGFVCFVVICFWAYSRHAKTGFDEAAMIPFRENDRPDNGQQH